MEGWRDEARRCKRGERNEGWSVGRISCLVSFTVARCVMTVEWIIISLSFRLLRLPPSRHSPFTLRPSLEPFLRVHPVRKLASSTLSPPSRHPPPAKTCKAEWAKGGWLVGRGRREGPSKGGSNDVTRGWERVEGSWKGDQGRTFREMFLFPCPFSSFRPLLPTRSSFLAPREDGSTGEREGGKRKKREKREEKGRCKPREKGLGGGVRRVGYVATDRYMNKRGYV